MSAFLDALLQLNSTGRYSSAKVHRANLSGANLPIKDSRLETAVNFV
jgi:hypothetical protein